MYIVRVSSSDKNLGWKHIKRVGVFSTPSSLGRIFRRISLIPPDCFVQFLIKNKCKWFDLVTY